VSTQVPTLGAVGLSYWVASLPASASVPALRQLVADSASAPGPAGAEPRAPADERGAGAVARGGRAELGRPGNGAAAEASAALGAVAGDLLAAGGAAAASPERERQLADLTARPPAGAGDLLHPRRAPGWSTCVLLQEASALPCYLEKSCADEPF